MITVMRRLMFVERWQQRPLGGAFAVAVFVQLVLGRPASGMAAEVLKQSLIEIASPRSFQLGAHIAIANALGFFKAEGLDPTIHGTQSRADNIGSQGCSVHRLGARHSPAAA